MPAADPSVYQSVVAPPAVAVKYARSSTGTSPVTSADAAPLRFVTTCAPTTFGDFGSAFHSSCSLDGVSATKCLRDRDGVLAHLEEQKELFAQQRFFEVEYHHLAELSFMTFRVTETARATGEVREQCGVERYLFRDGRIALKDVYRKPL